MDPFPQERLEQICGNRYKAVIITSKHARNLNSRMEEEEQTLRETGNMRREKIADQAIRDVLDGKVEVSSLRSI